MRQSPETLIIDGMSPIDFNAIMAKMEALGVIKVRERNNSGGWVYDVTPLSVQYAREIDDLKKRENEPRDIV